MPPEQEPRFDVGRAAPFETGAEHGRPSRSGTENEGEDTECDDNEYERSYVIPNETEDTDRSMPNLTFEDPNKEWQKVRARHVDCKCWNTIHSLVKYAIASGPEFLFQIFLQTPFCNPETWSVQSQSNQFANIFDFRKFSVWWFELLQNLSDFVGTSLYLASNRAVLSFSIVPKLSWK